MSGKRYRIGLAVAATAALAASAAVHGIWLVADLDERILVSGAIVIGRATHTTYDVVEWGGRLCVKRWVTIGVDEVVVAPAGEAIRETVLACWAGSVFADRDLLSPPGPSRRGAWLLQRGVSGRGFALLGPWRGFFVPEEDLGDLRRAVASAEPTRAYLEERGQGLALSVTHYNFTDTPREAGLWQARDGRIVVPPPWRFRVLEVRPEANDRIERTLLEGARGETGTVTLPARSLYTQWMDVSALVPAPADPADLVVTALSADDGTEQREIVYDDPHVAVSEGELMAGNVGRSVWWFPSARSLARWALAAPVLLLGGALLRRRGLRRSGALALGGAAGLVWAWALVASLPYGGLVALSEFWDGDLASASEGAAPALALVLAVPVAFLALRLCVRSRPRRLWPALVPWVLMPAAAILGSFAALRAYLVIV